MQGLHETLQVLVIPSEKQGLLSPGATLAAASQEMSPSAALPLIQMQGLQLMTWQKLSSAVVDNSSCVAASAELTSVQTHVLMDVSTSVLIATSIFEGVYQQMHWAFDLTEGQWCSSRLSH